MARPSLSAIATTVVTSAADPLALGSLVVAVAAPAIDEWRWRLTGSPLPISDQFGSNGSFFNGAATGANPTLYCHRSGAYGFVVVAHNTDGWSDELAFGVDVLVSSEQADQAQISAAQATATAAGAAAAVADAKAVTAQGDATLALAGSSPPVADLVALAALNVTGMPMGTRRYVVSVASEYVLTSGVYVADGIEIIAAAAPSTDFWVASLLGRWDDMLGDVSQGTAAAALTYEGYRDTPYLMYFFRSGQDDTLSMRFQFSHGVHLTEKVYPHLHVIPMSAPGAPQNVRLLGQYAWCNDGTAVPANVGWTTFGPLSVPYAAADQYQPKLIQLVPTGITPPVGFKGSSILLIYCQRNGTNPGDTYTTGKVTPPGTAAANLALASLDVHYRKATQGSVLQAP